MLEEMDFYDVSWDWGALGLLTPAPNECTLDLSSPSIPSSLESFKELNANHGKTGVFADWMDEKIDLSILDELEGQPGVLDDLDVMNGDQAALLDNWIDWSLLENGSGIVETKKNDLFEQDLFQVAGLSPPVSPGNKVPDISFAALPEIRQESFYQKTSNLSSVTAIIVTPEIKVEELEEILPDTVGHEYVKAEANSPDIEVDHFTSNTPPFTPPSSVTSGSMYLTIDTSSDSSDIDSCVSSTPPLSPASLVSSVEYAGTENAMEIETVPTNTLQSFSSFALNPSFSEKSSSQESQELLDESPKKPNSGSTSLLMESKANRKSKKQRKKYQYGKKAVLVNSLVPVEVRRKERKRVQNKDAATRYREKKRKEVHAIMDEELILEKRNKELHDKVDKLSNEISYLKGLLNEAKLRAQSRKKVSPNLISPVAV